MEKKLQDIEERTKDVKAQVHLIDLLKDKYQKIKEEYNNSTVSICTDISFLALMDAKKDLQIEHLRLLKAWNVIFNAIHQPKMYQK